jgi:amidohydrolase
MGMDPQKAPPHHSADFNIDEGAMLLGVKAFCHIVTDYSRTK